jgi:hypothetical protein
MTACELGLDGHCVEADGQLLQEREKPQLAEDKELGFRQDVAAMPRGGLADPVANHRNIAASTAERFLVLRVIATATLLQSSAIWWLLDSSARRRAIR